MLPEMKAYLKARKEKLFFAAVVLAGPALALGASAGVDWSNITEIITGLATNLIPAMVTLVTAVVPLLIILAIVGFILGFLKRILEMLHFQM